MESLYVRPQNTSYQICGCSVAQIWKGLDNNVELMRKGSMMSVYWNSDWLKSSVDCSRVPFIQCHSFTKLTVNIANVSEIVFVLEMDVVSTRFNFGPFIISSGCMHVPCHLYAISLKPADTDMERNCITFTLCIHRVVTSQNLWPRYSRHFVAITWQIVWS